MNIDKENISRSSNSEIESKRQPLGCSLMLIGIFLWFFGILQTFRSENPSNEISLFLGLWILYMGIISVLSYFYKTECFLFNGVYNFYKKGVIPVGKESNSLYMGIVEIIGGIITILIVIL